MGIRKQVRNRLRVIALDPNASAQLKQSIEAMQKASQVLRDETQTQQMARIQGYQNQPDANLTLDEFQQVIKFFASSEARRQIKPWLVELSTSLTAIPEVVAASIAKLDGYPKTDEEIEAALLAELGKDPENIEPSVLEPLIAQQRRIWSREQRRSARKQ